MLTQELREKLVELMKKNPGEAIKEIAKDPKILELMLNNEKQLETERTEKVKYVNMTQQMETQLQEEANKLKTTQGLLLGAGLLLLLSLLKNK